MATATTLKEQVKQPAFWATIITALGAVGSGLMEVGNPVTIAIGAAVTAIYTIASKLENTTLAANQQVVAQAIPAIQDAISAGKSGDYVGAVDKVGALVPLVEQQVGAVQTLIKDVRDQITILEARFKGYQVSPHVDTPTQTTTLPPAQHSTAPAPSIASALDVGGGHQVIGKPT